MSQYEKSRREAKSLFVHITSRGDINIYLEMKEFLKKKKDQIFFRIESYVQSTLIIVDLHMRQNLFRSKSRAVRPPGLQ